ncbi:MAG TPA: nucleotidyl transferase AbiEii/AbiGii toxin family protein [Anaerolineales bacterium]|nr:nucleotidyl transferase AbiEii/AbiGii toxin family protein [Anaerolineales bacterium]
MSGLSTKQIKVLKALAPQMTSRDFYLAGGTALAIHLGHRISVDLDWFTSHPFDDGLILAQSLRNSGMNLDIHQASPGTLHGSIQSVRMTFLQYQYPLLKPLEQWKDMSCELAALEDLACMKLSAIAQRGARKDFCDLYALGKTSFSLQEMLDFYQKKFGIPDIGSVLYGLVYFDDAERERMPRMLWDVTWRDMKKTILEWVKDIS